MKKIAWMAIAATGSICLAVVLQPVLAQEAKTPTVKQIMGKLNKEESSLTTVIAKGLNADKPAWDDIKKEAKEYATLTESLCKNKPPKGDMDSWSKLTSAYAETAKTLASAADKNDKKTAKAALEKIQNSCRACHNVHKGKSK
jgi:hypothetical protein